MTNHGKRPLSGGWSLIKRLHPLAGGLAFMTIAAFWLSTLWAELFAATDSIVAVKTVIPWGLILLVPALAAAGGSGFALAKGGGGRLAEAKRHRMPVIAANGLLILIPAALFLAFKAQHGSFDTAFYAVQAVELLAGAVNLALLGLNMRDGFRMAGRFGRQTRTMKELKP